VSAPAIGSPEAIVELQGVTKRFPGVLALDRIDLGIRRGEVHVLVGQNGAGKSTLVKLLCGLYPPDQGRILLEGRPYAPRSALAAIRAGIRVVYQEFNLLPYLTVAENVFFQRLPRRAGLVDFKRLHADAEALLREVGLDISPGTRVETLGVAQMQLLEIAKALSTKNKVLILDEPTATLSPPEIHRLFEIIARLKARAVTILYISHRLQEVFEVGDRITVLRNGRKVETLAARDASIPQIVRLMVGKEMGTEYPFHPEVEIGSEMLRACGWGWPAWSDRAGPRPCGRSSGPTPRPPGASTGTAARSRSGDRATRSATASACSPRTARRRGSSSACPAPPT
jgi:ribose transport system ATP-binding protein